MLRWSALAPFLYQNATETETVIYNGYMVKVELFFINITNVLGWRPQLSTSYGLDAGSTCADVSL